MPPHPRQPAARTERRRVRTLRGAALAYGLLVSVFAAAPLADAARNLPSKANPTTAFAFPLAASPDAGLPAPEMRVWRDTPQATVESLLDAVEEGARSAAAYTLDLSSLPEGERGPRGRELAVKLAELLRQRSLIDWSRLPDRPDGLIEPPLNANDPMLGVPRRAITLATLEVDGRDAPIMLMRMQPPSGPPVWLFSATTVRHIESLHQLRPRSWLAQHVPLDWRARPLLGMPAWKWAALAAIGLFSLLAGKLLSRTVRWLLNKTTTESLRSVIRKAGLPLSLALALLIWWLAGEALVVPTGAVAVVIGNLSILGIIAALTWMVARMLDHATGEVSRRFEARAATEEDAGARRLLTQLSIGRRVLVLIAVMVGVGIALSYFDVFRTIGLSLLFSAGALSVVLGIAANALLRNFLAGLQVGFAQPVRVGDTVTLSEHYGYVEDIGSVFLTMRTWNSRRLIVPYNVLLEQPIENWSKGSAFVIREVELSVDFDADLDALRRTLRQAVADSELADPTYDASLMVVGATAEGLRLWALVAAATPADAWRLEVYVRERLVQELLRQDTAVPRERVQSMEAVRQGAERSEAATKERNGSAERRRPQFPSAGDPSSGDAET